MRCLSFSPADKLLDANTIWHYRDQLVEAGTINKLFERLDKYLEKASYLAMGSQIVDATIVVARVSNND